MYIRNVKKIDIYRICQTPANNNTNLLLYDLAIHDIDILNYLYKNIKILSKKKLIMKNIF